MKKKIGTGGTQGQRTSGTDELGERQDASRPGHVVQRRVVREKRMHGGGTKKTATERMSLRRTMVRWQVHLKDLQRKEEIDREIARKIVRGPGGAGRVLGGALKTGSAAGLAAHQKSADSLLHGDVGTGIEIETAAPGIGTTRTPPEESTAEAVAAG